MKRAPTTTCLFLLVSMVALIQAWHADDRAPKFAIANYSLATNAEPRCAWHFLPRRDESPCVHSVTLAPLPQGGLLAVWYGGSEEAEPDVALYQARFHQGQWQPPQIIWRPEDLGPAQRRFVQRLGNPALFRDTQDRHHLFFVSVGLGGWAGSSINHMISQDQGTTWSRPRRIITSPFFNLSTLVRNPAVPLADGGFYLPVYHEMLRKYPELLHFDHHGRLVRKSRLSGPGSLQPTVLPVSEERAFCYLRNRFLGQELLIQQTDDGGRQWTAPIALDLANPDAPVATGRLGDGTLLMVYNPSKNGRFQLALIASRDGVTWTRVADLENGDASQEFSYPAMVIHDDHIDLAYTWKRDAIKHVRMNTAWIRERCHD